MKSGLHLPSILGTTLADSAWRRSPLLHQWTLVSVTVDKMHPCLQDALCEPWALWSGTSWCTAGHLLDPCRASWVPCPQCGASRGCCWPLGSTTRMLPCPEDTTLPPSASALSVHQRKSSCGTTQMSPSEALGGLLGWMLCDKGDICALPRTPAL
jgi:hypothetical protein